MAHAESCISNVTEGAAMHSTWPTCMMVMCGGPRETPMKPPAKLIQGALGPYAAGQVEIHMIPVSAQQQLLSMQTTLHADSVFWAIIVSLALLSSCIILARFWYSMPSRIREHASESQGLPNNVG